MWIQPVFHQLEIAVQSIVDMASQLTEQDFALRPAENKRSIGELLSHLAVICKADYYISIEASEEQMAQFYAANSPETLDEIKASIWNNYTYLYEEYASFTLEQLQENKTSYWGVTYSRYEWLLQILSHVYHHRGQLHTMLIQLLPDMRVKLFD